jgi:hypothetical protein
MKPDFPRLPLALLGAGLLLTGCANHPARSGASAPPATAPARPAAAARPSESGGETRAAQGTHRAAQAPEQNTPSSDSTGIPACDDYLASYVACHRAAAIYKPEQIPDRYQAMRTSLLRDSKDPDIRPQLAARCNSLASQLRQALHGKSCEGAPAAPGSQAGN